MAHARSIGADRVVDRIDAVLPQAQCRRCGYAACRPYAEAIVAGRADINQCSPGGSAGVRQIAALLNVMPKPLDPCFGAEKPTEVARVGENECIGCTLCIQACPVDAILGAPKLMHSVLPALCTGCELCIPPCPVDCIVMVEAPPRTNDERVVAAAARRRYERRNARLEQAARAKAAKRAGRVPVDGERRKSEAITRAMSRARARLGLTHSDGPESGEDQIEHSSQSAILKNPI